MFANQSVNLDILRARAYNLRWATVSEEVIPLTAADPDFPVAEPIREALIKYTRDGYFSYGPNEGLSSFRESLAKRYFEKRDVDYDPSYILAVDSAASGIYLICKTFLGKGDEAIIFDPVDFLFKYSIESVQGIAIPFATPQSQHQIDFSGIEKLITPRTKMICLCNPLNPTGKVFTKKELRQLAFIAEKYNLIILSDEIWSEIVFKPHTYTSIASIDEAIKNRTIIVTGFSKSYGLASLRVGAIMAPNVELYKQIFRASLHGSTISGCNVPGQIAATAAMDSCDQWLAAFLAHLQDMRDYTVEKFNLLPGMRCIAPEGCYVTWVDIQNTGLSSSAMQALLLEKAKVSIVPGLNQWFGAGAEGFIRISFATSSEILINALNRIHSTLSNL
jgi:aspartate/methionine/tyrosine aminotransferase